MQRYELTIATNYVSNWGLEEAVREIFQNAIDQHTVDPDREWSWKYHEDLQELHVTNKQTVLEPATLLLGATSKANSDDTIGKFGEGYKLALLVFARLQRPVLILNNGRLEVWEAKLRNSSKFGVPVLTVDITKNSFLSAPPNQDLTWIIPLTSEEFENLKRYNLYLRDEPVNYLYENEYNGGIIQDGNEGDIFLAGLYVGTIVDGMKFSYNLPPAKLSLDRDRRILDTSNTVWATSVLWADCAYSAMKTLERSCDILGEDERTLCEQQLQAYKDLLIHPTYLDASKTLYTELGTLTEYINKELALYYQGLHGDNIIISKIDDNDVLNAPRGKSIVVLSERVYTRLQSIFPTLASYRNTRDNTVEGLADVIKLLTLFSEKATDGAYINIRDYKKGIDQSLELLNSLIGHEHNNDTVKPLDEKLTATTETTSL